MKHPLLILSSLLVSFGRAPEFADRAAVDTIVTDMRTPGRGLRDMIHEIIASSAFQQY